MKELATTLVLASSFCVGLVLVAMNAGGNVWLFLLGLLCMTVAVVLWD